MFRKLLLVIAIKSVAYGSTVVNTITNLYISLASAPQLHSNMDRKLFLSCLLTWHCFSPASADLFNENEKITNFIKEQFYENCFGTESFNLMNSRIRRAKSQCESTSPGTPGTSETPTTTSPATSSSTSRSTTTTSAPASTTSRWSWMPPTVAQFPTFQNSHLVNPFQFYPQTFQYEVKRYCILETIAGKNYSSYMD